MFAALVILALMGVVLFWLVDLVERLLVPWHASQRHDRIHRHRIIGQQHGATPCNSHLPEGRSPQRQSPRP